VISFEKNPIYYITFCILFKVFSKKLKNCLHFQKITDPHRKATSKKQGCLEASLLDSYEITPL